MWRCGCTVFLEDIPQETSVQSSEPVILMDHSTTGPPWPPDTHQTITNLLCLCWSPCHPGFVLTHHSTPRRLLWGFPTTSHWQTQSSATSGLALLNLHGIVHSWPLPPSWNSSLDFSDTTPSGFLSPSLCLPFSVSLAAPPPSLLPLLHLLIFSLCRSRWLISSSPRALNATCLLATSKSPALVFPQTSDSFTQCSAWSFSLFA